MEMNWLFKQSTMNEYKIEDRIYDLIFKNVEFSGSLERVFDIWITDGKECDN